jgi:putative DNA primase/helicase
VNTLFHLSDLGNSERLVSRHGQDLRFCYARNSWLVWDGACWQLDATAEVVRRAKDTARSIADEACAVLDEEQQRMIAAWSLRSEARARIEAMIRLAESEPEIPVKTEQLDADPWLLNVANGTVNLRTGALHSHRREDLLTRLASVTYDPDAQCPLWFEFLSRIMAGNKDLINFLWRAVGYALTGDTREQAFFLLWGSGANGKSTFLETIRAMLGPYAQQADFSTFLTRNRDGIRNDVARMDGARFVSAVETESSRRLAEVLVKQVTGGDRVTARFLYREFFEFVPSFKLFLATNYKPFIRGTDHAIWRRIHLVPFAVTIPAPEQDRTLPAKLRSELPGILAWAVQGCLAWQREGLSAPTEVIAATSAYQAEMDRLADFLTDRCKIDGDATVKSGELLVAYQQWCKANHEQPVYANEFWNLLTARGFGTGTGAHGVRLRLGLRLRLNGVHEHGSNRKEDD